MALCSFYALFDMVHKVTDKVEEEQSEQTFLLFLLPHSVEKSDIHSHLKNISWNQCSVCSSINEWLISRISRNFWQKLNMRVKWYNFHTVTLPNTNLTSQWRKDINHSLLLNIRHLLVLRLDHYNKSCQFWLNNSMLVIEKFFVLNFVKNESVYSESIHMHVEI